MSESEQHDLQVIHSRWASLNQNHTKTRKESMVVQICCFWDVYGMFGSKSGTIVIFYHLSAILCTSMTHLLCRTPPFTALVRTAVDAAANQ